MSYSGGLGPAQITIGGVSNGYLIYIYMGNKWINRWLSTDSFIIQPKSYLTCPNIANPNCDCVHPQIMKAKNF